MILIFVGYKPDHSGHDQGFTTLLQTAKKCNVKLNYDKLKYKQNEIEYFGKTYTTSGCRLSKDKFAAITFMPLPNNKKQLLSFIGMINYLAKFSTRLSELAEPIRVAKDKMQFNWGPEHLQAFIHMKKEIASAPILNHYTPKTKLLCRQMPTSKVLVLVCYKTQNQCILQARLLQMPKKARLWLSWNHLQWLGQWRSSIIFFMLVIFCLKQIRNCLKPYYPRALIKLHQECREYLLEHLHTIFTVKYIPGSTNQLAEYLSWLSGQRDTIKQPKLHVHQITNQLSAQKWQLE